MGTVNYQTNTCTHKFIVTRLDSEIIKKDNIMKSIVVATYFMSCFKDLSQRLNI